MKIKKNPFRLGSPKTDNPLTEMSWCHSKHIYVSCIPKAEFDGNHYKQKNQYALTIRFGGKYKESEYIYDKDNIQDAILDAYRDIYNKNKK